MILQLIDSGGRHGQWVTGYRSKWAGAWSLALLVGSVNAACNAYRPEPDFQAPTLATPVEILGTPLTQVWSRHSVRGPSGPMAVDSLCIYIAGSDHRLTAVDLATGANRWVVRLQGPVTAGVFRAGDLLYTATDQPGGAVHAMKPSSGNKIWTTSTGYVDVPLTLIDGRLMVMNRDGILLALDPQNGKILWRRKVGRSRTLPVTADSTRLLAATMDSLFLVDRKTGTISQRERAPGALASPWVEQGQELITATGDSAVLAVDRTTMRTVWRFAVDAPVLGAPALRGDTLIVVTRIGTIYRILLGETPALERVAALALPITAQPILLRDWVLLSGADGAIHAIDQTGAEVWKIWLGRPVEVAPFRFDDSTMFGIGGQGQLGRYRL